MQVCLQIQVSSRPSDVCKLTTGEALLRSRRFCIPFTGTAPRSIQEWSLNSSNDGC